MAHYSTYGELYKALSEQTGEIPIAIYRTEKRVFSYDPSSAEVSYMTVYSIDLFSNYSLMGNPLLPHIKHSK